MREIRSALSLLLVICLGALLLGGCILKPKTPEEVVAAVVQNLSESQSISYDANIQADLSVNSGGETADMQITMNATADTINNPLQLMTNVSIDMGSLGSQKMQVYAEANGEQYDTYYSLDNGQTWTKRTLDAESFAQYQDGQNIKSYLSMLENIKENGTETIGGVEAVRFDGDISSENMVAVLENAGVFSQFEQYGLDEDAMKKACTELGDLPFSVWVDTKNDLPVRYQFDLGSALQRVMDSYLTSEATGDTSDISITVGKYDLEMTITGINTVKSIERPANLDEAVTQETPAPSQETATQEAA